MPDDLFDDWVMPSDTERESFVVDDQQYNGMVRRYRRLRREVRDIEAQAAVERARIDARQRDLVAGADRDMEWIETQLCAVQRAILDADPKAKRTLPFLAGGQAKASAFGGQPVIVDATAYAQWATRNEYVDRDADVKAPWEMLLLAVSALRWAQFNDGQAIGRDWVKKIADDLDIVLEGQTRYRVPSYDAVKGRIGWNGDAWIDRQSGEVVPGLGRADSGWNVRLVVDE